MASSPVSTPAALPTMKAARRPCRRVIAPTGRMQAAMPTTKMEIGKVASNGVGANWAPTMAPVANTTTEFAPASAWASDRRQMLARWTFSGRRSGDRIVAGVLWFVIFMRSLLASSAGRLVVYAGLVVVAATVLCRFFPWRYCSCSVNYRCRDLSVMALGDSLGDGLGSPVWAPRLGLLFGLRRSSIASPQERSHRRERLRSCPPSERCAF